MPPKTKPKPLKKKKKAPRRRPLATQANVQRVTVKIQNQGGDGGSGGGGRAPGTLTGFSGYVHPPPPIIYTMPARNTIFPDDSPFASNLTLPANGRAQNLAQTINAREQRKRNLADTFETPIQAPTQTPMQTPVQPPSFDNADDDAPYNSDFDIKLDDIYEEPDDKPMTTNPMTDLTTFNPLKRARPGSTPSQMSPDMFEPMPARSNESRLGSDIPPFKPTERFTKLSKVEKAELSQEDREKYNYDLRVARLSGKTIAYSTTARQARKIRTPLRKQSIVKLRTPSSAAGAAATRRSNIHTLADLVTSPPTPT